MCEPRNRDNGASDLWTLTAYWGQTSFRVNDDPEIGQLEAEYDSMGQSDGDHFDPELSMTSIDPFPGHVDLGVFRAYIRAFFFFAYSCHI